MDKKKYGIFEHTVPFVSSRRENAAGLSCSLLTKGTVCPKARRCFRFVTTRLAILLCRTGNANHLSEVNAALSHVPFLVFFHKKRKTYKMGIRCVYVCVKFWSPPNNFQTSYPIDTKIWLHIVSYRNSPTPLIPFLNFENCALEKFLKLIFSPFN